MQFLINSFFIFDHFIVDLDYLCECQDFFCSTTIVVIKQQTKKNRYIKSKDFFHKFDDSRTNKVGTETTRINSNDLDGDLEGGLIV